MLQSQMARHTFLCFSQPSPTAKLANGNTGHAQVIGIILCHFPNCLIIYPVGPVYYCPGLFQHYIISFSQVLYWF